MYQKSQTRNQKVKSFFTQNKKSIILQILSFGMAALVCVVTQDLARDQGVGVHEIDQ